MTEPPAGRQGPRSPPTGPSVGRALLDGSGPWSRPDGAEDPRRPYPGLCHRRARPAMVGSIGAPGPVRRGGGVMEPTATSRMWSIEMQLEETDDETQAEVVVVLDGERIGGWGRARRNPADPAV